MKLSIRNVFYPGDRSSKDENITSGRVAIFSRSSQELSAKQGETILNMARETSPFVSASSMVHSRRFERVLHSNVGRGRSLSWCAAGRRLPRVRTTPRSFLERSSVGLFEGLSCLTEEMASTFYLPRRRDGRIYARTLMSSSPLGVTAFALTISVGHENEEGIESGAFWFYRTLGFRPLVNGCSSLRLQGERLCPLFLPHARKVLRQLATGSMISNSKFKDGDCIDFKSVMSA